MSYGENSMEKRCWENLSSKYAPNKRGIKTTSFIDTWYFCNKYNVTNTFDSTKKRDSFSQAMRQKGWCFTLSGDQPPAHHNKGSWRQSISRPAWVKIYTFQTHIIHRLGWRGNNVSIEVVESGDQPPAHHNKGSWRSEGRPTENLRCSNSKSFRIPNQMGEVRARGVNMRGKLLNQDINFVSILSPYSWIGRR